MTDYSEDEMAARIERLAEDANAGCGLVYELFVERFSGAVDHFVSTLPADRQEKALALAKEKGYATPEELDEDRDSENYCVHHLPYDCCPVGCGDLDY